MEKKNKFVTFLKEHKRQVLAVFLLIALIISYTLILSEKVSAMSGTTSMVDMKSAVIPYTVIIDDEFIYDGGAFVNLAGITSHESVHDGIKVGDTVYAEYSGVASNTTPLEFGASSLATKIVNKYDDAYIRLYDIRNLGTSKPQGLISGNLTVSFGWICPTGIDKYQIPKSYIGTYSTTIDYLSLGEWSVGDYIADLIISETLENAVYESQNGTIYHVQLTDETYIELTNLEITYDNMTTKARALGSVASDRRKVRVGTTEFIVDNTVHLGVDDFGERGTLDGYVFRFYPVLGSLPSNMDWMVGDSYTSPGSYKATSTGFNYVMQGIYSGGDEAPYTMDYRYYTSPSRQENITVYSYATGSNGFDFERNRYIMFNNYADFYNSSILSVKVEGANDLFIPANGEWGYFSIVKNGCSAINIEQNSLYKESDFYNNFVLEEQMQEIGGVVRNEYTMWKGVSSMFRDVVGSFFDFEPFGTNMSIGDIVQFMIGIALLIWVIKLFMGG